MADLEISQFTSYLQSISRTNISRAENLETFVKKHLGMFSSFDAAPATFLPLIFFMRAAVKEQRNALFTYSTVISRNKRMH